MGDFTHDRAIQDGLDELLRDLFHGQAAGVAQNDALGERRLSVEDLLGTTQLLCIRAFRISRLEARRLRLVGHGDERQGFLNDAGTVLTLLPWNFALFSTEHVCVFRARRDSYRDEKRSSDELKIT